MYWRKTMTASLSQQSKFRQLARSAWRSKHSALAFWLLSVALAMTAPQGWAACIISAQGVSFGNYDPSSNLNQDSIGNISLSCSLLTLSIPYTISLSTGGGSYAQRTMASGVRTLNYNLYTALTHTSIWGNGTGGTATVNGVALTGLFTGSHAVYGSILAKQNAYVGSYSDSITVTLTY